MRHLFKISQKSKSDLRTTAGGFESCLSCQSFRDTFRAMPPSRSTSRRNYRCGGLCNKHESMFHTPNQSTIAQVGFFQLYP